VIDYRDWQVPLGRRFRALKLWFVIRHYGVEGLRAKVREHVEIARDLCGWIEAHPDFELAVPAPLNLVCFRHRGLGRGSAGRDADTQADAFNERLHERLNADGAMYLTHTRLQERYTLRFVVGQTHTTRRHVEQAWARIVDTAAALQSEPG
jgi:aromatic-L-amino-acid decarboxylase